MKRWLFLLIALAAALALSGQDPTTSRREDNVACGRKGGYACHCPAMVAAAQNQHEEECARTSKTRKDYLKCMADMPMKCDIIEEPYQHGVKSPDDPRICAKWCRLDLCYCGDGMCKAHGNRE